jgi:hypothetical protein
MMTLNEVACALNDRILKIQAQIDEIVEDGFDELYYGKELAMRDEIQYLTTIRDKILGE